METTDKARERAEKRVDELRGFYIHLTTYCIVNLGLFCINFFFSPNHWWFFWPLIGWGIGLTIHGITTWKNGFFGENWRERKINEIINKG